MVKINIGEQKYMLYENEHLHAGVLDRQASNGNLNFVTTISFVVNELGKVYHKTQTQLTLTTINNKPYI